MELETTFNERVHPDVHLQNGPYDACLDGLCSDVVQGCHFHPGDDEIVEDTPSANPQVAPSNLGGVVTFVFQFTLVVCKEVGEVGHLAYHLCDEMLSQSLGRPRSDH